MLDAPLVHANSCPYNTLLTKHRFIVPSLQHKPTGKRYIKKKFRPPSQLTNKWYFQTDICNTGLLLLTTTAVNLDHFFLGPKSINNNITIWSLNPIIFENNGFQQIPTTGYAPKNNYYLYANTTRKETPNIGDLSFLGKPGPYTIGEPFSKDTKNYISQDRYWGNPFHPHVLNKDIQVYTSNVQPSNILTENNKNKPITDSDIISKLTLVTDPLVVLLRYNPDRDTGENNTVYLINNTRNTNKFEPPDDENITIHGFPLHIALWGWLDWQKKLAYLNNIDKSYVLTFITKFTDTLKTTKVIPIDHSFLEGRGPYNLPQDQLNQHTLTTWYPKCAHQLVTINDICTSGPATPKYDKNIEAHCSYDFKFKWGGCPAPMTNLTNPCSQTKYPVPNTILQGLQGQNPSTLPQTELHDFDERHEQITKKCLKRIAEYTESEQTLLHLTGPSQPETATKRQKIQENLQTPQEKKETETLQQQLQCLRNQQHQLKRAILQLMRPNIE